MQNYRPALNYFYNFFIQSLGCSVLLLGSGYQLLEKVNTLVLLSIVSSPLLSAHCNDTACPPAYLTPANMLSTQIDFQFQCPFLPSIHVLTAVPGPCPWIPLRIQTTSLPPVSLLSLRRTQIYTVPLSCVTVVMLFQVS